MERGEDLVVSGSTLQEVAGSLTKVMQSLPPHLVKKLRGILIDYVGRYTEYEEAYARFNNRTVRQIFDEYQPADVEPLASGEVDGVRYTLHEGPLADVPDSE